jgi:rubrerythrin
MNTVISPEVRSKLLDAQKNEVTEAKVYENITKFIKDKKNREIVEKISAEEKKHSTIWQSYTTQEVKPNSRKVWFYTNIIRFLGLTFGLKLMEHGEKTLLSIILN